MFRFTSLPQEVLEEILRNLDCCSLLRACSVCRHLKTIIADSSELQYIIELSLDGMMDSSSSALSHADRLAKLRDRRKAWSSLSWKKRSVIQMRGLCHAYELVEGVFVKASGGLNFLASWLPSSTDEGRQIRRGSLEMEARDFAIDPGQDLIIFVEEGDPPSLPDEGKFIRLLIRTISTHEAHPAAEVDIFQFFIAPDLHHGVVVSNIIIQIADDILAVFFSTGFHRLLLWNWKEGILITDSRFPGHELPDGAWDFSFISSRAYIITSTEDSGFIQINTFDSEEGCRPVNIATLCLPELQEQVRVNFLYTHTGPFGTSMSDSFTTSPKSRLHVLTIQYLGYHHGSHTRYCVFVHNRTFLAYVAYYQAGHSPANLYVPWRRWGPMCTRFFAGHVPFTWLRYVQGQRVVCPQAPDTSTRTLQVLDFNIYPSCSRQATSSLGTMRTVYTEPSRLPTDHIFQNEVISTLSYSATTRAVFEHYSAFMIDEERVVGLKVS
ncbi:hypothetical protein L208DRAFT_1328446 [Tricholoma matsutake]|nr:hypothetical protein L208DRAFT_1328446 [Tricholoma matsutake 945]